jgi:hypothetical protein
LLSKVASGSEPAPTSTIRSCSSTNSRKPMTQPKSRPRAKPVSCPTCRMVCVTYFVNVVTCKRPYDGRCRRMRFANERPPSRYCFLL